MGRNGFLFLLIAVSLISAASTSRSVVGFRKLAAAESSNASQANQASSGSNLPVSKPQGNTSNDQSKKSKELDSPMISDEKRPDVSVTTPDEQKVSKKDTNKKNEAGVNKQTGIGEKDTNKKNEAGVNKQTGIGEKDTNKKNEAGVNKQTGIGESCNEKPNTCSDKGALSACILASGNNEFKILIQNKGDTDLKIKLDFPSKVANDNKGLEEVLKHQTKKINVSVVPGKDIKLVLNAGHGDCTLLMGHLVQPGKMAFIYFPTFDKLLTPINGVYLSVLTVAILAGFVACWKCRKTRQGEVRYQQLEMGSRGEAPGAMNVKPVDGWDEGWDDDWDEENAVRSPAERYAGSISVHGLTSRTSNKDGWENDWDD